ncbi:MAG TPA: RNA polymerase sigma factor SigJ [Streptosporangiaceae bacterium]|jgi:RNA polymerase sigma-70 factor (ECF subfamily)
MDETTNESTNEAAVEAAWRAHHKVLIDVAYRLLGSVSEAEDAVSEGFARLARENVAAIDDVRGWLVVVVSRVCLDQLGSARKRREAYVGTWLPEPVLTGDDADPAERITLDDSVRMALLVVLERMAPAERVAFVLHDVFQYDFAEIAEIVGRSSAACRQLASRGRRRVRAEPGAVFDVDPAREEAVARRFLAAAAGGDAEGLLRLLDPDVVLRADGGGLVVAPHRPVTGAEPIVKIIARGFRQYPGMSAVYGRLNGGPGMAVYDADGTLITVAALTVRDGRIHAVDLIANPEKLARLAS